MAKDARAFERMFVSRPRPLILTDLSRDWPARRWTLAALARRHPNLEVQVQVQAAIEPDGERHVYETMTLGAYIEAIGVSGSRGPYLSQLPIALIGQDLLREAPVPSPCPLQRFVFANLWAGPAGTNLGLHVDYEHNFFTQIEGRKQVRLIGPHFNAQCYPAGRNYCDMASFVDAFAPDLKRYPRFAEVELWSAELGPGETLFIPADWWHHVRAVSPSLSINLWWFTPRLLFRNVVRELRVRAQVGLGRSQAPLERKNSYLAMVRTGLSRSPG